MVSFWPFRGDDTSAASFEKVLSQLSTKINKRQAQHDSFRQKQRRYKVLWTLYSTFAYILVAAILTLVTGYQRWSAPDYTAIVGSPVLIYGIRTALDAYYNYRIANSQNHLNDLQKQRETAIQKLKKATKYDSTQQLLDRYGGTPGKRGSSPQPSKKRKSDGPGGSKQGIPQGPRTGFAPPPTANIQRGPPAGGPMTPQGTPGSGPRTSMGLAPEAAAMMQAPNEEFAPNAFSAPSRPPPALRNQSKQYSEGPKWYDRILDVVLGEDETQSKNRLALICENCRLVNGQAPPGARTAEDIGRWRCSACHAWNGVESPEKKMLMQMTGEPQSPTSPASPDAPISGVSETSPHVVGPSDDDSGDFEHVDEEVDEDEEQEPGAEASESTPAGSTRSKARQRKKA